MAVTLSKVFLDYAYWTELERLAFQEGLLTRFHPLDTDREPTLEDFGTPRIRLSRHVLELVTLCDSVDTHYCQYDISALVQNDLVRADSEVVHCHDTTWRSHEEWPTQVARANVAALLKQDPDRLFRLLADQGFAPAVARIGSWRKRWVLAAIDAIEDWAMDPSLETVGTEDVRDDAIHSSDDDVMWLHGTYNALVTALTCAIRDNAGVATLFFPRAQSAPVSIPESLGDLHYLVNTRLDDELLILPQPRTLREAIELRQRSEMKRFREVLGEWLTTLSCDSRAAEQRIRSDVAKANAALTLLKRWRRYEQSPLNLWLNVIGGQIPVLSHILTITAITARGISSLAEKRFGWVGLAQNASATPKALLSP